MAAKSSEREDRTSGANLQMEGHADMPSQSAKDPRELGALGSSPSHLLSWSPARKPPSNCPNTRHCLEIHVTLTEELGAVPPTISCLDGTPGGGYAVQCQDLPH